jgi:predicted Zn-dependent protease
MKYTPHEIRENVNVSKISPLKEFIILTFGIAGFLIGLYILLGLALDLVIPQISPELEDYLSELFAHLYQDEEKNSPASIELQQLLNELAAGMDRTEGNYQIHLVPHSTINAMALPGGHIVIFSGLLEHIESENELAMILGHELGHFNNRDHLRGLGRGLVLMFLSSVTLGIDSRVSQILQAMLVNTEMKFSQKQELQSDLWGLQYIMQKYGHAGGATDFFRRLGEKEKRGRLAYFFATHPFPDKRVQALDSLIREKAYPVLDTEPLNPVLHDADEN